MRNTIKSWLEQAKTEIDGLDAELILLAGLEETMPNGPGLEGLLAETTDRSSSAMSADRSYLVAHAERELTAQELERLDVMLQRRRAGEPLAYILGEKEFYGREFTVTPAVLIPRPETEALIDLVKTLELPKKPRFCEIGTGSGCIAITLALEYLQAEVLAVDISQQALEVAAQNDREYEGRVEFAESDLLAGLDFSERAEKFDVLIANLPYVDKNWRWLDRNALSFEPEEALYAAEKGLALYRRLLEEIQDYRLRRVCRVDYLVFEADPVQHEALIEMAQGFGFALKETQGYGLLFEREIDGWC